MFEVVLAFVFGLLIGSFLNVCIYRWPLAGFHKMVFVPSAFFPIWKNGFNSWTLEPIVPERPVNVNKNMQQIHHA